jgi:transposase
MSEKELKRVTVIKNVSEGLIKQIEASELLELSARQIRRLSSRVKESGERGIMHRLRGQASNRKKPESFKKKILELCEKKYTGFNPTFASEKLLEEENLEIHPETLRLWFRSSEIEYERRRGRKHRRRRERKEHFGEMIQLDGSHHNWFEGRGSECVLMGYIDDATGIYYCRFYEYEGTKPAFDSFKRYIKKYGIPKSVYLDKHSTYKSTKKLTIEEQLENIRAMSNFERSLEDLGVQIIHANSPQAKGRIERSFKTHQDRLVKEMRLRGISTIKEANKFLSSYYIPKHNRKFSVAAKNKANLHRALPKGIDLDKILCIKKEASLRNDFTVSYNKKLYQVLSHTNAKKVIVEERINGKIFIIYKGRKLKYKQIEQRPVKQNKPKILKPKETWIPPIDHPWRYNKQRFVQT